MPAARRRARWCAARSRGWASSTCCCSRPPSARAARRSRASRARPGPEAACSDARPDGDPPAHARGGVDQLGAGLRRARGAGDDAVARGAARLHAAIEQRRKGGEVEAIPFLERALGLDPAFAAAATTLSTVYGNLGEGSKSVDYARLAYAQRDRVSQRERLFIVYQYHDRVTGNFSQAADTLEVWKRTYPNDFQPPNALAIIDNRLGRYERGVEQAKDALVRTPGHPFAVSQLAHAYRGLGRYDEARRVAEEAVARGVATVPTRRLVYQLAVMRGDAAAAARQLEWAKGKSREFDIVAAEAQVAAFSGQLRRASELYGRSVALAAGQGLAETGLSYVAHDALTRALYGRPKRRWRSRAARSSARTGTCRRTRCRACACWPCSGCWARRRRRGWPKRSPSRCPSRRWSRA